MSRKLYIHQIGLRRVLVVLVLIAGAAMLGMRGVGDRGSARQPEAMPLVVDATVAEREAGYEALQRFVGRVEFRRASAVSFEVGGLIARVHVDEGDPVEAGEVLAELDVARLQARRAELVAARDEARARIELARLRDDRARRMLGEDVISPQQADDARLEVAALAASLRRVEAQIDLVDVDLEKSLLRAPFAGEVSTRFFDPGVVADPGQPVLRVLETSGVEVRVGVSAEVARSLADGEWLELSIGDRTHAGRVLAVLRERRSETRTVPVRIAVEDAGADLREGDLAEVHWRRFVASDGFWLPRSALTEGARGLWAAYVATTSSEGERAARTLERRPVELLHERGDDVYVRGAMREGEAVVRDGVHRLVPGQLVRVAHAPGAVLASAGPVGEEGVR